MNTQSKHIIAVTIAIVLGIGILAGVIISVQVANAQAAEAVIPSRLAVIDPSTGGHVGENGVVEEELMGEAAQRAQESALGRVQGGTILRLETDAEGAAYEAHMLTADGNPVTVKLDGNFAVLEVQDDMAKPAKRL